jgi:IS5 family transposase
MSTQLGFGSFERTHAATRRERFLSEMERVVPWAELCSVIAPYYPTAGQGRPPLGLERMLRIYFLQQWFDLSDPAMEEMLYDSRTMSAFAKLDLVTERAPDETTICKFRHMIEAHSLGQSLFVQVQSYLATKGIQVSTGTIVDATIVPASSSTKNKARVRDPEMRSTKKNGQWYYGMKAHVGVDAATRVIHHATVTAANVHDSQPLPHLLHGNETEVWGDKAYIGQSEVIAQVAPKAKDRTMHKASRHHRLTEIEKDHNRHLSKTRSRVEHVFGVMKHLFGFRRVRYRGLRKNENRFVVTCALINLYLQRTKLLGFGSKLTPV